MLLAEMLGMWQILGLETIILPPAEEVTDTKYEGKELKVPIGTGLFLRFLRIFGELPIAYWNWKLIMQTCGIGKVTLCKICLDHNWL